MSLNANEETLAGNVDPDASYPDADNDATQYEYRLFWYWCWIMFMSLYFMSWYLYWFWSILKGHFFINVTYKITLIVNTSLYKMLCWTLCNDLKNLYKLALLYIKEKFYC